MPADTPCKVPWLRPGRPSFPIPGSAAHPPLVKLSRACGAARARLPVDKLLARSVDCVYFGMKPNQRQPSTTMIATHNAIWGNAMTQHHSQAGVPSGPPPPRYRGRGVVHSIAVALAAVSLLAACTTPEASPPPIPSGSSTTQPVESTAPAPPPTTEPAVYKPATEQGPAENVPVPVLPEAAKEFSKEGLIAFTEHWYATLGYAFETGDPEPMMAISDVACPSCEAMRKAVIAWHSEGRWIAGGAMTVVTTDTSFVPLQDGSFQVVAMVRQSNVRYFRADKTLADDKGTEPTIEDLILASYSSGEWTANNVSHMQGSRRDG